MNKIGRIAIAIFLIGPNLSYSDAYRAGIDCKMNDSSLGLANRYRFAQCESPASNNSYFVLDSLGKLVTATICDGLRCSTLEQNAVSELVNQVNPAIYKNTKDVAASNYGLRSFFKEKMQDKSCFGALAFRFYGDISLQGQASNFLSSTKGNGDVWKTAMNYAGGDEPLAIALIGACGHDDAVADNVESTHVMCFDETDQKIAAASGASQCAKQNKGLRYRCPSKYSKFFSQGGLKDVEIPSELKLELAKSYAPNSPPDKSLALFPLKYYHVYGAAYLTCQLIENGVPKEKAIEAEKVNALLYRAVRVCSNSNSNIKNYTRVLEEMKSVGISIPTGDIFADPMKWNDVSEKMILFLTKKLQGHEPSIFRDIGLLPRDTSNFSSAEDQAALLEKIKNYPGIVLAGHLTRSQRHKLTQAAQLDKLKTNYGSGALMFNDIFNSIQSRTQSSLLRLGGPALKALGYENMENFTELAPCLDNSLINFATGYRYQCNAYADCDKAQEKLISYAADFLQTKKYHELGAEFSAQKCKARPKEKGSFGGAACEALEKFRSRSADTIPLNPNNTTGQDVK